MPIEQSGFAQVTFRPIQPVYRPGFSVYLRRFLRLALHITKYHKDCWQSCAIGRCHWCGWRVGPIPIRIIDGHNLHLHQACAAHAEVQLRKAMNVSTEFEEMYHIKRPDSPVVLRG